MAEITGPKIITSGLVLALDAADINSYPRSGNTWYNISENGNNGTLINGPTFNSANGGSFFTDGSDDYISTPYSGSATDSYTFSVWFKNDNYSENKFILSRGRDQTGVFVTGWSLYNAVLTDGRATIGIVITSPSLEGLATYSTSVLALNTWYYITGVWTASTSLQVYVNGVLENTLSTAGKTVLRSSTNGWVLSSIDNTIFTNGYTAACHIYNRVLSGPEILQNYNALKIRFGL